MAKISARDLENRFYNEEVAAATGETRPISYFLVTNPGAFGEVLDGLFETKKVNKKGKEGHGKLDKRKKIIKNLMTANLGDPIESTQVGSSKQHGLVDLVSIPWTKTRNFPGILNGTPFSDLYQVDADEPYSETFHPLILFREHHCGKGDHRWEDAITGKDLKFISQIEDSSGHSSKALTPFNNLFIQARDGSDLTAVRKLIRDNETHLALQRLRSAAEYTLSTWLKMEKGPDFKEPKERSYLEYAKEEGLSKSDFAQGLAFMQAGNEAIHNDYLAYDNISARLFLHWLDDFVGRTFGHHRLPKSRKNGTSSREDYELVTDEREYRLVRGFFDFFQRFKSLESEIPRYRTRVSLPSGEGKKDSSKRETVMGAAVSVVDAVRGYGNFAGGLFAYMNAFRFWGKQLEIEYPGFTAEDAKRAAMFAHHLFYHSREIDERRLVSLAKYDGLDPNLRLSMGRKGMEIRRYDHYRFKEKLEPKLKRELNLIGRVVNTYFPEHSSDH